MSCFWDSLIKKLDKNDITNYFKINNIKPEELAQKLKDSNRLVNTILVNDCIITKNQQKENFEHINNFDINTINNGYLCSTFDPFLILISDLLSITISNNYVNTIIIYKPIAYSRYNIYLENDKGHMK